MSQDISIRIILENPLPGIDFGIQSGRGKTYKVIQKQRSQGEALQFDIKIKARRAAYLTEFGGIIVQGEKYNRCFYINIGSYTGKGDSIWGRRIKISLSDIPEELILSSMKNSKMVFVSSVCASADNKTPSSSTNEPFIKWQIEYNN